MKSFSTYYNILSITSSLFNLHTPLSLSKVLNAPVFKNFSLFPLPKTFANKPFLLVFFSFLFNLHLQASHTSTHFILFYFILFFCTPYNPYVFSSFFFNLTILLQVGLPFTLFFPFLFQSKARTIEIFYFILFFIQTYNLFSSTFLYFILFYF